MSSTCLNCRFWHHIHSEDNNRGECRRYAPRAGSSPTDDLYVAWAETRDTDWCGEYEEGCD